MFTYYLLPADILMKKILPILITLGMTTFAHTAAAETLLEVYADAKANNPELKKTEAERQIAYAASKESFGDLLPEIGVGGEYDKTYGRRSIKGIDYSTRSLQVQLTQSLFDMTKWRQLTIAQKKAGIEDVMYETQKQSLILDTAVTYFNVLKSLDTLSTIGAKKAAIYRQLEQTQQRHKVGLLPVMDVQNAQAQYDMTVAEQVNAKNALDNALEDLRQVSGRYYAELTTITNSNFKTEMLYNVNQLQENAESNNLNLLTARLAQDLANEQIKLAHSAHYPTVEFKASSALSRGKISVNSMSVIDKSIYGENKIGATFTLPIFVGGKIMAKSKQAQYNFQSAAEQVESTRRAVIKGLRSSYNNITASISAIHAYQQTVVSAESSLKATQSSYNVGTRTIVDVLNATTTLYDAKRRLSESKFNYLISLLQLKTALGELNENDLAYLNNMLGTIVSTDYSIK